MQRSVLIKTASLGSPSFFVLIALLFPPMAFAATSVESALAACRALVDRESRLVCYDRLAEAQTGPEENRGTPAEAPVPTSPTDGANSPPMEGVTTVEPPIVEPPAGEAADSPAAPEEAPPVTAASTTVTPEPDNSTQTLDAEALFGRDGESTRKLSEQALGVERLKRLQATVAELRQTPSRKWIVTLSNDQVWAQTDTARLNLKAGDEVEIRAGSLGSHYLRRLKGGRQIPVKRID